VATLTSTTGAVNCTARYDPFGSALQATPANPSDATCNTGTAGSSDVFWHDGRRDAATKQYQFGARTYDPAKGAFLTPDAHRAADSGADLSVGTDPLTMNTYGFVNGDPINLADPSGHRAICGDDARSVDDCGAGPTNLTPLKWQYREAQQDIRHEICQLMCLGGSGDTKRAAKLQQLLGRQILFYNPNGDLFAEVFGNLDTATNLAVVVPGSGQGLANYFGRKGFRSNANNLQQAAESLAPGQNATIAWEGYKTPGNLPEATDYRRSVSAGRALASFVGGIQSGKNVSLIGHSYGSLVTAHAVADGLRVNNFVAIGSPGLAIVDQSELDAFYSNSSRLWAARTPDDPYAGTSWKSHFGVGKFYALSPYDDDNGFAEFRTNGRGGGHISGHNAYFSTNSVSLANMARIVTGAYDDVSMWGG
jgi:RHS repeat-associated protein